MTIFSSCHLHFGHISQPFHSLCQYLPQISPRMTRHKCQICSGPNIARFTRVRSVHLNLSGRAVREILLPKPKCPSKLARMWSSMAPSSIVHRTPCKIKAQLYNFLALSDVQTCFRVFILFSSTEPVAYLRCLPLINPARLSDNKSAHFCFDVVNLGILL